jgi:hypothetical protein
VTSVSGLPTVACVVIAEKEDRDLQGCLQSVLWVDELVEIDAGSSGRFGARRWNERRKLPQCS